MAWPSRSSVQARAHGLGAFGLQAAQLVERLAHGLAQAAHVEQGAVRKATSQADDTGLAQQLELFSDGGGLDVLEAQGKHGDAVQARLMKRVPAQYLVNAHYWLILHGHDVGRARQPLYRM